MVALSGGVDSSVTAHLLREQGHDLVGVMMQLWMDPLAPDVRTRLPNKCCSIEHIARARAVCQTLGIPFYVLNLEAEFKRAVIDPFLSDYASGNTPNPCISCNRFIKFGALLDYAKKLECDALATGHYVRVAREHNTDGTDRLLLLQAVDEEKDQSYFLYTLTQDQLQRVLFPLGGMYKKAVYELAKRFDIDIPDWYAESQDLCFYPEREPKAFLKRYLDVKKGDIRTEAGEKVGTHEGLPFYTIGQRKGLGIGGLRVPLHVTRKEPQTNTLYVATAGSDARSSLTATACNWIAWQPSTEKQRFAARISSLGHKHDGTACVANGELQFTFDTPVRGVAPGQSIVLYRQEEVIGGGIIANL